MWSSTWIVFAVLALGGCAELGTSEQQRTQTVQALREWFRGPMMSTCAVLPGPESQRGCVLGVERTLAEFRSEHLTREDHYRIELAKANGTDEIWRLWTRTEREAWLLGPRTHACHQGPRPSDINRCLEGVQKDLDVMSRPDDLAMDPPEVRAERAVARIQLREQERAIEQQRAHERDLVQQQAAGQALMGLGIGGGLFRNTVQPAPVYHPSPTPILPLAAPRLAPPVSCSNRQVGSVVHTDCY